MDNTNFGLKEIYDVTLKATYNIEINGKQYEKGEVITMFDKIQIANFDEIKSKVSANGGYDNRARVIWEDTKEVNLLFTQGIFTKTQFAMLSNSRLLQKQENELLLISQRDCLEIDENGEIELKRVPRGKIFVYCNEGNGDNVICGKPLKEFELKGDKTLVFNEEKYLDVVVDYTFEYDNKTTTMVLGQRLIPGYVSLEGKTRVKEDITGHTRTGIIKIPKLKLMSDLSIRLGSNANPVIGNFRASGFPIGEKGSKKVMEIIFLNDDIDSDM